MPHVRIGLGREELLAAYRLVLRRYRARGFIYDPPGEILYSAEFAGGDSRTLVSFSAAGNVTATATFVGRPAFLTIPSESVIPWSMMPAAPYRRRIAGVTCMAIEDSTLGSTPMAFFALARFLFQYARHRDYDGLVVAIHPRQVRFYQRICPLVPLGPAYRQPKLGDSLAIACRIDLDEASIFGVPPATLSWFETPIAVREFLQPGINAADNAFLTHCADCAGFASAKVPVPGQARAA